MHDAYFSSLLVIAGLCVGLSVQSRLVSPSAASAATIHHLSRLALLEGAFCVGFCVYTTSAAIAALRWYILLVALPLAFLPRALGDLIMHLTGAPDAWVVPRRFASYTGWVGLAGMIADAALRTDLMYSEIQEFGPPYNMRFPAPALGGLAFLACWGGLVMAFMGRLVLRSRGQPHLRPLLYGAGGFGLVTLIDLATILSGQGFYQLQHVGFLILLLGAWTVIARQSREDAERLRLSLKRLEVQQHQLLHEGPRIQQQKLESLGTLAAGIAHEVLNPITSIMNYAQLIRQRGTQPDVMRSFVDEVMDECRRVTAIVRSLLTFARREDLIRLPEDPHEMIEETCRLMAKPLASDGIELEIARGGPSRKVSCTRQQIQQVLLNLLQNAQHALNAAYPEPHPNKRIRISVEAIPGADAPHVRVNVEDWGTGISEADQPRVFDPFFTNRPDRRGTGLGLSVSHGIVVDHGGTLEFESLPGRYTRFSLSLPAAPSEQLQSRARQRTKGTSAERPSITADG